MLTVGFEVYPVCGHCGCARELTFPDGDHRWRVLNDGRAVYADTDDRCVCGSLRVVTRVAFKIGA